VFFSRLYKPILDTGNFFLAMLANLGSFLDDFGTKRAFSGEITRMNFLNGFVNCILQRFMPELQVSNRLNGFTFTDVTDPSGSLSPPPCRFG
jgi:hypothetical protein